MAGAFSGEAIAAAATVVLSILALAGIHPAIMVPVAVLTTGCALLLKSGGVAGRLEWLLRETNGRTELETGMSAGLLAGVAGIILGILTLIGLVPATLPAIAVIVFGGALLLGGGETFRVSHLGPIGSARGETATERAARMSAESAASAESLVGIAAVVLGILAIVGIQPALLVPVGLLCLGGAMLLSGAAVSARMFAAMRY
jgi:hypothetical protein